MKSSRRCLIRSLYLLPTLLAAMLALTSPASAYNEPGHITPVLQEVALLTLPVEAKTTMQLIKQGGPFPYNRDGAVFGNYEKQLPKRPRGYYHEYTVKTPGARNRGARRIVCEQSVVCYYTDDHYQTFKLIRE